jgi:hypothetical protein
VQISTNRDPDDTTLEVHALKDKAHSYIAIESTSNEICNLKAKMLMHPMTFTSWACQKINMNVMVYEIRPVSIHTVVRARYRMIDTTNNMEIIHRFL